MAHQYDAVYFRNSQYSSLEEAKKANAVSHWHTTYGYTTTLDAFLNVVDVLKCFHHDAIKEFVFVFTIDNIVYPEMDYKEVFELLHRSSYE